MSPTTTPINAIQLLGLVTLSLLAFAANSILCRYALVDNTLDAGSFTLLRLLSGTIVLLFLLWFSPSKSDTNSTGSWLAGFMLFVYAAAFSYAYLLLGAAMGALILFGVVQLSMMAFSLWRGEPFHLTEWIGIVIAFSGLVYLVLPDLSSPSSSGVFLMIFSGVAWALYTVLGQSSVNALADTTYNFLRASPFAVILIVFHLDDIVYTQQGVVLAVISGGITSALGYVIWYQTLRHLTALQTAVIQLLVPIIIAIGGIIFLSEAMHLRLIVASLFILSGITLVIVGRYVWSQINPR